MITIRHGSFDNWFVLVDERGREINSASIEGDREQWAAVADAIERNESIGFKRVAFRHHNDGHWSTSSPRNSMSESYVSAADAAQLVVEIRRVLAETPVDAPSEEEGEP